MTDWQTDSSEVVYETPWIKLRKDELHDHNGKPRTYTYLELHSPGVGIVATDKQGRILLQRDYRYTIKKFAWGIPAGHSDGQDLLVAAKRELREETGLASEDWTDLGTFYIAAGVANIQQKFFLARSVHLVTDERDEDEQITEQRFCTTAEVENMLRNHEIDTHMTPIGVYMAKLTGLIKE